MVRYYKLCGGTPFNGNWVLTHPNFLRSGDIYYIEQPYSKTTGIIDIF